MSIIINEEILISYLNNSLNKDEHDTVEQWLSESEDHYKLLEQTYYTMFVSERSAVYNSVDVDKSLQELRSKIKKNENEKDNNINKRKVIFYIRRISVAAVFIGVLFLGWTMFQKMATNETSPLYVVTGSGERAQVILPDGTKVWIGACSKIEYISSVSANERIVTLEGEAYFEVAPDKKKPFVVNSSGQVAKVLGTKFNIRANKEDRYVITTLLEGSLSVSSPDLDEQSVILKPSEQLTFNVNTGSKELQICDAAEDYISWVDGHLYFNHSTMEEIARELERYYNVKIILDDKIKEERFTANFDTSENIYQILSILKMTNKFDYKVDNRNVEIYSR